MASNPGNVTCTYTAKRTGSVIAIGRGYSVVAQHREVAFYEGSVPSYQVAALTIFPGDVVRASATLPGSAVYVGEPDLLPQLLDPPGVGVGSVVTPQQSSEKVNISALVGTPAFLVGRFYAYRHAYLISAEVQMGVDGTPLGVRVQAVKYKFWDPDLIESEKGRYFAEASDDVIVPIEKASLTYSESAGSSIDLSVDLPSIGATSIRCWSSQKGYLMVAREGYLVGGNGQLNEHWLIQTNHGHDMTKDYCYATFGNTSTYSSAGAWGAKGTGYALFPRFTLPS